MYAVIRTGGKQYRVAPGDVIRVESVGSEGRGTGTDGRVEFSDVLAVSAGDGQIGKPQSGALVTGDVVEQGRGEEDSGLPLQTQEAVQEIARTSPGIYGGAHYRRLRLMGRSSRLRSFRRKWPSRR